ncbi:MAG: hypothetical protein GWO08_01665, partial [Gammaproteobacteria bacterium]|nr:hypothetical protein [Gammaproteobacteria bacterium]NIQ76035.1 hypothetical protein [Gammaproteobacteria bacterium]NIR92414.1 hypothetical protein [Gammaproteobacteria bacterium]NIW46312.1 hypothetical protein [Gammaproteobacteria bacterium]NIW97083.1 hypothetical protein [Phycisphaerae bacterium]
MKLLNSANLSLIEKIEKAFADVEYPGDDNLTNSYGDEADALVQEFTGKTDWRTCDAGFLDQAPAGWA